MTGQDSSAHPIPTFRFAPSPNGYLHLGHAFSAVLNCDMARKTGGRFLLRIEDIDTARSKPEFETAIYEDLDWLGLAWEEPVRRQSEHLASYAAALKRLDAKGLIYPSFESRAEIARLVAERERVGPWPRDPDGVPIYPGEAKALEPAERTRRITAGEPYGLRLDVAAAIQLAAARTSSHASVAGLTWTEMGRRANPEPSSPRRRRGATSYLAARTRRQAIISPWRSTTRCRASPTWCAERICSGRPACTASCSFSSICRNRSIITIA
jgi:hypothetical protein